jgi:hypothetical protein
MLAKLFLEAIIVEQRVVDVEKNDSFSGHIDTFSSDRRKT